MRPRPLFATLLLAASISLGGCDTITGSDLRDGHMAGVWAHRPFEGSATALVHDERIYLFAESLPDADGFDTQASFDGGRFLGVGTYELEGASVWYMASYDEVGATYDASGGKLVIDEVKDGAISGGIWFNARSSQGETPVGSHARFYARFEAVPLEYRP